MLSVVLSMVGCCMLITNTYNKWDDSPVIVTFSEKMISTRDIPFPAVTICPEIKSSKTIFNLTDTLFKIDLNDPPNFGISQDKYIFLWQYFSFDLMLAFYRILLAFTNFHLCDRDIINSFVNELDEMITNYNIFNLIKNVSVKPTQCDN